MILKSVSKPEDDFFYIEAITFFKKFSKIHVLHKRFQQSFAKHFHKNSQNYIIFAHIQAF